MIRRAGDRGKLSWGLWQVKQQRRSPGVLVGSHTAARSPCAVTSPHQGSLRLLPSVLSCRGRLKKTARTLNTGAVRLLLFYKIYSESGRVYDGESQSQPASRQLLQSLYPLCGSHTATQSLAQMSLSHCHSSAPFHFQTQNIRGLKYYSKERGSCSHFCFQISMAPFLLHCSSKLPRSPPTHTHPVFFAELADLWF